MTRSDKQLKLLRRILTLIGVTCCVITFSVHFVFADINRNRQITTNAVSSNTESIPGTSVPSDTPSDLPPEVTSYLDYQPSGKTFHPTLKPLVQCINHVTANDQLAECVKMGQDLLPTISRGLHDETLFLIAYSLELQGDIEKALETYSLASALSVRNVVAKFRHAALLKKTHQCDAAVSELKEVLWQSTALEHEVLQTMGECLIEMGKQDEGIAYFQSALAKQPGYLPALRSQTLALVKKLDTITDPTEKGILEQQVLGQLKSLSVSDPGNKDLTLFFAKLLTKTSDPLYDSDRLIEAKTVAEGIVNDTKSKDPEAVRVLSDVHMKLHELELAQKVLEKGLKKNPTSEILKQGLAQLAVEQQADIAKKAAAPETPS